MKITAIKQQVKNPERVSIFVDEKYEFSLSLDELVKYKIKSGAEVDKNDIKKYKKISEDGKLRARSLEWLLNRPHSTKEFQDYLYRKKADPDLSEKLISEFTDKAYLDDAKFATWFIELKARKNKSQRAIKSELTSKGIRGEDLDAAFETSELDERAAIREVINKKSSLARYKDNPVKLKQYLASQGFSYDLIKEELSGD